jgi:chaperone modulatory protein CbpM
MEAATERMQAQVVGERDWLDVTEICRVCCIEREQLQELAELGVVMPRGPEPEQWRLPAEDLPRLRVAGRLMRDLGVNVSGAALAVELLEVQHDLERRVRILTQITYS